MVIEVGRLTVSVEEAGTMLGISRASAYKAVREGEIPVIRLRSETFLQKSDVYGFFEVV